MKNTFVEVSEQVWRKTIARSYDFLNLDTEILLKIKVLISCAGEAQLTCVFALLHDLYYAKIGTQLFKASLA